MSDLAENSLPDRPVWPVCAPLEKEQEALVLIKSLSNRLIISETANKTQIKGILDLSKKEALAIAAWIVYVTEGLEEFETILLSLVDEYKQNNTTVYK